MYQLITIRISHYNEKARWALDRFGVPYCEEPYMPAMHFGAVLGATWRYPSAARGDRVSTRFSTPVLVTGEGPPLCDSRAIVRFVSERYAGASGDLYPDPECAVLEDRFHDVIGPHTRRIAYNYCLGDRDLMRRLAERNVSRRQSAILRVAFPALRHLLVRGLVIDDASAERSLAKLRRELPAIEERLGERRYFVGDRFTAADLALACMMVPVILPTPEEGYGAVLPTLAEVPSAFAELVAEMRARPAGAFALRMFRDERRVRLV